MDTDQSKGTTEPSEAQPIEDKQLEPMPGSEENQAPEVEEVQLEEDASLPDGVKERTREQFEKLKNQIRELKSAQVKETIPQYGSAYEEFRPQPTQQPEPFQAPQGFAPQMQNFVDADGNLDVNAFQTAVTQQATQQAIAAANQIARDNIARLEETQEVKEAHGVHPEIDPTNKAKFDRELYDSVRDRILRNKFEGKKQTLAEVTADIKRLFSRSKPASTTTPAQAVEQYKQTQEARNQGPIEQGKGASRSSDSDLEDLKARTRQGDDAAFKERMRKLGY